MGLYPEDADIWDAQRQLMDDYITRKYAEAIKKYTNTNVSIEGDSTMASPTSDINPPWQIATPPKIPVPMAAMPRIELNRDDPFEKVLIDIVNTNRRKRRDYAADGDPFSNFRVTADLMGLEGFDVVESALFNVCQKLARLKALRTNGRMNDPANESVTDTYLDLAVYAIITYAIHRQVMGNTEADGDH